MVSISSRTTTQTYDQSGEWSSQKSKFNELLRISKSKNRYFIPILIDFNNILKIFLDSQLVLHWTEYNYRD